MRWGHSIKPSSKLVMPVAGCSFDAEIFSVWKVVTDFPVLGHVISSNGGTAPCFKRFKAAVWKAFFSNAGSLAFAHAPAHFKLKLLNRVCKPALDYRCSRLPPHPDQLKKIDRLQARLVAATLREKKLPHEIPGAFATRRNRKAAAVARKIGRWSGTWCRRIID